MKILYWLFKEIELVFWVAVLIYILRRWKD